MSSGTPANTEEDPPLDPITDEEGFEDIDEGEEIAPLHYGISSYGADFPVDGLVKRMDIGDIVVPTFDPEVNDSVTDMAGFQRDFVWSKSQADRFIESLLLGFPIPGIFLVQGPENVFLVLDGQQRLRTLQAFYKGSLGERVFRLQYVQPNFRGLSYEDLDTDARRRLDNSIIHATIVRQEEPSDDQSSIYQIFERLNTGGTLLQPQEIRVALFSGPLVNLLRDLNGRSQPWRELIGNRSKRLKDQELILRFFAMRSRASEYKAPMKEFLNSYAGWNRSLDKESESELKQVFNSTVSTIHEYFGVNAFRPVRALNVAVVDAVMTVVAEGLSNRSLKASDVIASSFEQLMNDTDFRSATERATAREENVVLRLSRARAFLLVG
jgi:hypothetical protein